MQCTSDGCGCHFITNYRLQVVHALINLVINLQI